jgi:hypothetical protein
MKKLVLLAVPFAVFSGIASAAAPACNPLGIPSPILVSAVTPCQVGDKVFFNFSVANLNPNDSFTFIPNSTSQYTVSLSSASTFGTNFTFSYDVSIDPAAAAALFPGKLVGFTQITGAIIDTVANSSSSLSKAITANAGTGCPGGVTVTESVAANGNGSQNSTACNLALPPAVTSVHVAETYTYTGGTNPSGVTQLQNTFTQGTANTSGVPEPVSMLLFGSGLLGISVFGRKRFARK